MSGRIKIAITVLLALAVSLGAAELLIPEQSVERPTEDCWAIDGDTIGCDGERIRLNGIDSPEMNTVAGGDARLNMEYLLIGDEVAIERFKQDYYGRTVAQVVSANADLSCEQLRSGNARYVRKWDERGRTRAACPELAR